MQQTRHKSKSNATDWTKIYKRYKGMWIVLNKDEKTVISTGKTAKEALEKSHKKKEDVIFTRIPTKITTYVGAGK